MKAKKARALLILLLLSIMMSFPIEIQNLVTGQNTGTNIQAFGTGAQDFANALRGKAIDNNVIVASEANNLNTKDLESLISAGTTLVTINSTINGLVEQPELQLQSNSTFYKPKTLSVSETNSTRDLPPISTANFEKINSTQTLKETIHPEYWISVTKYGVQPKIQYFVALNSNGETIAQVFSDALNCTITKETKTLPGFTPEPTPASSAPNSPLAAALPQGNPDINYAQWTSPVELDYTLYWGSTDFVKVQYFIYEANRYSTASNCEYWLVSTYMENQFGSYHETDNFWYIEVGPMMSKITNTIDANADNQLYEALQEHGPMTTVPQETATLHFGFTVDSGGPSATLDYTYQYAVGENSFVSTPYGQEAKIVVEENFAGDNTHINHNAWQTAIFRTPVYSGFDISLLHVDWDMQTIYYWMDEFGYYPEVYYYEWTINWNPARFYGVLEEGYVPSYHYVSSISATPYTWGSAGYYNVNGIVGSTNNNDWAHLWANSNGAMVQVQTMLDDTVANNKIVIRGYAEHSGSNYYDSHMLVFVSTDASTWHQAGDTWIYGNTPYDIDAGSYSGSFRYVLIVAYNSGKVSNFYIDSIRVYPN